VAPSRPSAAAAIGRDRCGEASAAAAVVKETMTRHKIDLGFMYSLLEDQ
jgi:hypothetical protein